VIRMRVRAIAAPLIALLAAAPAFDAIPADLEVEQLRRDIRELERTVAAQGRRIEQLERQPGRGTTATPALTDGARAPGGPPARPQWLAADRWQTLTQGITTQRVVEILGPPTAVRMGSTPEERTLLYTLELDDAAFLSGAVHVRDDRVVAVERPTLK